MNNENTPPAPGEHRLVANAGMVIAAPFLPMLFDRLGLLRDGVFVDTAAAGRAVHLLQFMATGQSLTPAHAPFINKILCGLDSGAPVPASIDITLHEQEAIEGLLRTMIADWECMANTSLVGLREFFLMRDGELRLADDGWHLRLAPRPCDLLLDQLPWSCAVVKPAWMTLALHVTWR